MMIPRMSIMIKAFRSPGVKSAGGKEQPGDGNEKKIDHGLASSAGPPVRPSEGERKCRSLPRPAFDADRPAVGFHDLLDDGQSEPGPRLFPWPGTRKNCSKTLGKILFGNPLSRIGDRKADEVILRGGSGQVTLPPGGCT